MEDKKTTFASDFKRFFFRGLGILLPSVLTLWILVQLYFFVEARVAEPINRGIRTGVLWVIPRVVPERNQPAWFRVTPEEIEQFRATLQSQGSIEAQAILKRSPGGLREELRSRKLRQFWDAHWYFRFIGLFVAITAIYLAGRLLGGYLGRGVYRQFESFVTRVPVFNQIYPHVKQLVDLILGERSMAFKRVVLVEYPRKGIWTIGFVTGSGIRGVADVAGGEIITVFIPSTPTPFTGFTITVKTSDAIDLPISIDEAIRFVLTGGVLTPSSAVSPLLPGERADGSGPGAASGGSPPRA